jgi:hypothetical protein
MLADSDVQGNGREDLNMLLLKLWQKSFRS